jgi:heme a synthase
VKSGFEEGTLNLFKRFTLLSVLSTYFLIFVGGLVRVSGAGLGCPDWPKCFNRWIPPFSASQLPEHIDPGLFNFTLAWIEYINRLVGMFVGFAILGTAILAIVYFRSNKKILWPSIFAALLVAFQGWQGGQVVASELEPMLVSSHLLIAILIVNLLLYVLQQINFTENHVVKNNQSSNVIKLGFLFLWLFIITQIMIGTQVRGAIEVVSDIFPLLSVHDVLERIGPIEPIHRTMGLFAVIWSLLLGIKVFKSEKSSQLKGFSFALAILGLGQLAVGAILVYLGLPALMQLFHLWIASLITGFLLLIYTSLNYEGGASNV